MTPELITALFTGVVGVIAAVSAFTANRSRRVEIEHRLLKGRVRKLEQQVLAMDEHVHTLERSIVQLGGKPPARPEVMENPLPDEALRR